MRECDKLKMIEMLTRHELEWLISDWEPIPPGRESNLDMAIKFFSCGGFATWSDEELKTKFEMHFDPEEIENA
jgi:hypothetical protein